MKLAPEFEQKHFEKKEERKIMWKEYYFSLAEKFL